MVNIEVFGGWSRCSRKWWQSFGQNSFFMRKGLTSLWPFLGAFGSQVWTRRAACELFVNVNKTACYGTYRKFKCWSNYERYTVVCFLYPQKLAIQKLSKFVIFVSVFYYYSYFNPSLLTNIIAEQGSQIRLTKASPSVYFSSSLEVPFITNFSTRLEKVLTFQSGFIF